VSPTQGRLRRTLHARIRDRVRRGVRGILDDDTDPVFTLSGHHREPPVPVPVGGIKTARGIVEGLVMDRESQPQSQNGLEEAEGLGIIPGKILRL